MRTDPKLSKILVAGVDPGGMDSGIGRRGSLPFRMILKLVGLLARPMSWWNENGIFRPTWKSAEHVLRAAFEIDLPADHVLYLNGTEPLQAARQTRDAAKQKALWQYGREAAKIQEKDTVLSDWQ